MPGNLKSDYKNKTIGLNIGFVLLIFVVAIIIGGGREGSGIPLFIWSYAAAFILNTFICIGAVVTKNKSNAKIHLAIVIVMLILAAPIIMLLIGFTGGLC